MALLADLKSSQEELEAQLSKRMADFEAQLRASSPHADSQTKLASDFYAFRDLVWGLLKNMRQQITDCANSMDSMEMRYRRKALLFNGIPESVDNVSDAVISTIQKSLELPDIEASQIVLCHRLGEKSDKRSRPVLVRFSTYSVKATVWKNKTLLKGTSVSLCEFLTRSRQATFVRARSYFGMRNCWSTDGVITVKLPDGIRRKINTGDELDRLIQTFPKSAVRDASQTLPNSGTRAPAASKQTSQPSTSSSSLSKVLTRKQTAKK
ncbi:hypothetical protein ABMA28_010845 [Loxostege sticticalis]|uniref:Uncharacterized protein n=1 Tax=Loxostege sticticalis TaxID=481309 RepID=A0ABD0S7G5_LOXSC